MLLSCCRLTVALGAALLLFPLVQSGAGAFGPYPAGTTGFDISYPQCDDPPPAAPFGFGIVGVNGGRAFFQNPCLVSEFAWAQTGSIAPSFFINLNSPAGSAAFKGRTGPRGTCRSDDNLCLSYNFGHNSARLAFADAQSQEVSASMWWLDIETDNTWSDNLVANAQVIQGALDYLRSQSRNLGVYSTPKQWGQIVGTYNPGIPNWVAGAPDLASAPDYCAPLHAFGGGTVWLVQFNSGDFDGDYACGAPPTGPASTAPSNLTATAQNATTVQLNWAAPTGSVDSYSITNGVATVATVRAPTTSYTITGLAPSSYHCYAVSAQSGGSYSVWTAWACLTTPPS